MYNASISRYKESQITSSTPEETVLLLYDGAIRFLRSAIQEITANNNIPEKAILIEKIVKILDYLQSCLDTDKGGNIAENLHKLYDYMLITLTQANLKNDTEKMKEVLNLLLTVREGWYEVCTKNKGTTTAAGNHYAGNSSSQGNSNEQASAPPERKVGVKA
jgi:flagellar protein FliS